MNSKRLTLIIVICLFLQACGIKFWYNRLDWLVPWYVDDYVELTSSQESALEQLMLDKTQWHRTTQLPLYINMLENMIADVESNNIANSYDQYAEQMKQFYQSIANQLIDDLMVQMAQLSDQQVTELLDNLSKEANKQQKKYQKHSPEQRLAKVIDNLEDNYSDWTGRLSKAQKSLIKEWAQQIKPTADLVYEFRAQWRDALLTSLRERSTPTGQKVIKQLLLDSQQLKSEQLNNHQTFNEQLEKQYMLKLLDSLSEKQKKKVIKKLRDYQEDFEDLLSQD
ncbi:MAG: hypothetical protein HWD86_10385 [Kangiellaceae bacterium]|nr:hypothetical protein [Kangiellaceae bacterium]